MNGHVGVADVLLTYGADIEAKDMYGRTSLMVLTSLAVVCNLIVMPHVFSLLL